jgi:hypothetical protein
MLRCSAGQTFTSALTYRELVRASARRADEWAKAYSDVQLATRRERSAIRAAARAKLAMLEAEKQRVLAVEPREYANYLTSMHVMETEARATRYVSADVNV